jgi:HYR domain-containing protein
MRRMRNRIFGRDSSWRKGAGLGAAALASLLFLLSFANSDRANRKSDYADREEEREGHWDVEELRREVLLKRHLSDHIGVVSRGADFELGGTNEPTLVVDPNDPDHVAYASLGELRVSTDGGTTWQPAVSTPFDPATHLGTNGDPSLAYDSQGRLFWTYLASPISGDGLDLLIAGCDPNTGTALPGYPVNLTASAGQPGGSGGFAADKEWLAADFYANSPFRDRLYVGWQGNLGITASYSTDQGQTWSAAIVLSTAADGELRHPQNTVAPNGDAYLAYHSLTPSGTAAQVILCRSTNGGVSYPQKTIPYAPGEADMTTNCQGAIHTAEIIPGTRFLALGSWQAWVLADPIQPGRIYVISADDPDNDLTSGDAANVYIATSNDNGLSWSSPQRIDAGPDSTFQVFPTAAIDPNTGCIAVQYYDNRNRQTNSLGNWLLDLFVTASFDGGLTWRSEIQASDRAFDPDANPPSYGFCEPPPTTYRIGEYTGIAIANGVALSVWCGNFATPPPGFDQQSIFDRNAVDNMPPQIACPSGDLSIECAQAGGTPATDPVVAAWLASATASDDCDASPELTNDAPSVFPVGSTTVTWTAQDEAGNLASCSRQLIVTDTMPPSIACPADITVECSAPGGTPRTDPQLASFFAGVFASDICDPAPAITDDAPDLFPPGITPVMFTATDAEGNAASCVASVNVIDTTPPTIDVTLDRDTLWPPNHRLATITATVVVEDVCDPDPTFVLTQITSDEPDDGEGDANTMNDIQDADYGTPDVVFRLRSERQGGGDGRTYTILYTASDAAGNTAMSTVTVGVPHDAPGSAIAMSGFSADGREFLPDAARFTLVVLGATDFDAGAIVRERVAVGHHLAVVSPVETFVEDLDGDGREDFSATFEVDPTSTVMNMEDDGITYAVGMRYDTGEVAGYLVPDILELGQPLGRRSTGPSRTRSPRQRA